MTGDGTDDAATNESANANDNANDNSEREDEFDRHRRRVLWALPTGLYLIGSRHGDEANLMTANLVVQVCLEPKLVGVALERDSMTARLVAASGAFTISLLQRGDRDVVRRFVKPVTDVDRDADGVIVAMSGHRVSEVGSQRLPVLSAAAGHLACTVTRAEQLGSHTFCIGEVTEVGGEPDEVLRMEDTRMHYGG
jgi:flavin reductase (DIM6/NTAB) family NADH-FMN oxidoreductase RutF